MRRLWQLYSARNQQEKPVMVKTPVYIRTTMSADGKTPKYEVMRDGIKIADISYVEMIELAMNITSALRFMPH